MAEVKVQRVRKAYGNHEVIHGVDVEIGQGEFVVLVGPSGCGKSTLLRMIAGLEEITGGAIMIDGKVVNDVAPKDRDIAMVFQSYALYPHMTVAENMGFSLRLKGVPKDKKIARVKQAAQMLGLVEYLDRYPRNLSGGQRQRVAMGRAIVRDPQVFLFDEPLSNLDANLRVQMRTEIKELHQRVGTTTIYVTHDQVEAMTMADRIVVLRGGYVEQIGTPAELYDRPANRFVASFIGSPAMNFVDGAIVGNKFEADTGWKTKIGGLNHPNSHFRAVLGIRPEDISVVETGKPGSISAEVSVVEPTGPETLLILRAGAGTLTLSTGGRQRFKPGDIVGLALDHNYMHFFDPESGKRLPHGEAELPARSSAVG